LESTIGLNIQNFVWIGNFFLLVASSRPAAIGDL